MSFLLIAKRQLRKGELVSFDPSTLDLLPYLNPIGVLNKDVEIGEPVEYDPNRNTEDVVINCTLENS